jgi:3-deoxy-D-manno-octulosonic-acid transferase
VQFAYVFVSWLLVPVFIGHLLWRSLSQREYRRRVAERFGFGLPPLTPPAIWVHAVSVGEVTAAAPLIRALRARYPGKTLVVTTMTPTGAQRLRDLFGNSVAHSYVPYDMPGAVRRFLRWAKPELAIIIETEIWPSLYRECGRQAIPLVMASARISPKSLRRYRVLFGLIRDTLAHGIVIAAQTAADAERFRSLGASPARTHVTGNIKFDFELPADVLERGRQFRALHAGERPVWIAASTHHGEEEIALQAHRRLLEQYPRALLILVPRHPERFATVAALVQRFRLRHVTRSSGAACAPDVQVFIGDSMGELTMLYAAADAAFVGGSLVPVGGHNLLEPAALCLPILTGRHTENAVDIAEMLRDCGAAREVAGEADLAGAISALFADRAERQRRGAAGRAVIEGNRGALGRLLALVYPLLRA